MAAFIELRKLDAGRSEKPTQRAQMWREGQMSDKARERRYLRLIRDLKAAVGSLEEVTAHEPILSADETPRRLRREIEEYAGYLEHASWWRASL